MSHATSPANRTAWARLKVAMVFLSTIRSALETAKPDSMKTAKAAKKEITPANPLDNTLMRNDTIPPRSKNVRVDGRTKRRLYLLARVSVAERVLGICLVEDVDDN